MAWETQNPLVKTVQLPHSAQLKLDVNASIPHVSYHVTYTISRGGELSSNSLSSLPPFETNTIGEEAIRMVAEYTKTSNKVWVVAFPYNGLILVNKSKVSIE